jgi:hypothetical protein
MLHARAILIQDSLQAHFPRNAGVETPLGVCQVIYQTHWTQGHGTKILQSW